MYMSRVRDGVFSFRTFLGSFIEKVWSENSFLVFGRPLDTGQT